MTQLTALTSISFFQQILRNHLPNRLGPFDADKPLIQAAVEVRQLQRVQAHQRQDRGVQMS